MDLDEKILSSEILPARTFGFLRDVEALQARGLALGGSRQRYRFIRRWILK